MKLHAIDLSLVVLYLLLVVGLGFWILGCAFLLRAPRLPSSRWASRRRSAY